jgi:hypothetical protein
VQKRKRYTIWRPLFKMAFLKSLFSSQDLNIFSNKTVIKLKGQCFRMGYLMENTKKGQFCLLAQWVSKQIFRNWQSWWNEESKIEKYPSHINQTCKTIPSSVSMDGSVAFIHIQAFILKYVKERKCFLHILHPILSKLFSESILISFLVSSIS